MAPASPPASEFRWSRARNICSWVGIRSNDNFGQARLTGQFFDKDGKPLEQVYVNPGESDRWTQPQRRLVRSRGSGRGEQVIPEHAVEFELKIEANGGFDVDGLYFGEFVHDALTPSNGDQ